MTQAGDPFAAAVAQLDAIIGRFSAQNNSQGLQAANAALAALATYNNTAAQKAGVLGGVQRVSGKILVQKAGEVAVPVSFPVLFVEEPDVSFGGVMDSGQAPVVTNFPTVSCVVLRWKTSVQGASTYYVGATLGIVTAGEADHRMWVHWHVEGRSLTNPTQGPAVTTASSSGAALGQAQTQLAEATAKLSQAQQTGNQVQIDEAEAALAAAQAVYDAAAGAQTGSSTEQTY